MTLGDRPSVRKTRRITATIDADMMERVRYWADRRGGSASEYVARAIEAAIRRENRDYDLPTLETQRMNQLVDHMESLSSDVRNLSRIVTDGFDSLTSMTRGDSYFTDGSI